MSDLLAEDPCSGCGESTAEAISLDELESALTALESESALEQFEISEGFEFDAASLDLLDELALTPPTAESRVTLEELLALLEEYPGLKFSIGY